MVSYSHSLSFLCVLDDVELTKDRTLLGIAYYHACNQARFFLLYQFRPDIQLLVYRLTTVVVFDVSVSFLPHIHILSSQDNGEST